MTENEIDQLKPLLKEYVEKSSAVTELHWDKTSSSKLLFDPYSSTEKEKTAHYFLLISALDTAELVGTSEKARAFMVSAHSALGNGLFIPGQKNRIQKIAEEFNTYYPLGPGKYRIPQVLESINLFVDKTANGSLVKFAQRFSDPECLVKEIATEIPQMGGVHIDHAWMYLRWMVRPYPDLGVFQNISAKKLKIPLTSFVRNVAYCLGLCKNPVPDWSHPEEIESERANVTEFANHLFPEDPAVIDYPFYVLGRWIRDEKLSFSVLKSHLQFWKKINGQLNRPIITFDVVARNESTFEKNVREELNKLKLIFLFEPYPLSLPKESPAPHYKPDFVLPRVRRKGHIVLLEPHGIWTPLEKRIVSYGRERFPMWVTPSQIYPEETEFVDKLRFFRQSYKDLYYLILIVPSSFKERVEKDYPDIFDEIYDGADIPKLLYELKKSMD
ncbi:MAG: DUF2400 family protein [Candidatus Bathyarchaeia archaeon]|jgi:hypothetical protein